MHIYIYACVCVYVCVSVCKKYLYIHCIATFHANKKKPFQKRFMNEKCSKAGQQSTI